MDREELRRKILNTIHKSDFITEITLDKIIDLVLLDISEPLVSNKSIFPSAIDAMQAKPIGYGVNSNEYEPGMTAEEINRLDQLKLNQIKKEEGY